MDTFILTFINSNGAKTQIAGDTFSVVEAIRQETVTTPSEPTIKKSWSKGTVVAGTPTETVVNKVDETSLKVTGGPRIGGNSSSNYQVTYTANNISFAEYSNVLTKAIDAAPVGRPIQVNLVTVQEVNKAKP